MQARTSRYTASNLIFEHASAQSDPEWLGETQAPDGISMDDTKRRIEIIGWRPKYDSMVSWRGICGTPRHEKSYRFKYDIGTRIYYIDLYQAEDKFAKFYRSWIGFTGWHCVKGTLDATIHGSARNQCYYERYLPRQYKLDETWRRRKAKLWKTNTTFRYQIFLHYRLY